MSICLDFHTSQHSTPYSPVRSMNYTPLLFIINTCNSSLYHSMSMILESIKSDFSTQNCSH